MTLKKLSLSALVFMSLAANINSNQLSNEALVEAYQGKDSEWKYIEFLFIEKPKAALNSYAQKVRAIGLGLVAGTILTAKLVEKTTPATQTGSEKKPADNVSKILSDLPVVFSAGVLGLISFDSITSYIDASIKHDTLVNFLKDWDFHKEYVPASLIPAFDELATAFESSENQTFTADQVNSIFEVIQHLIEHEFSKRYEKDKKKDSDTLGIVKTITDISKNLK